MKLYLFFLFLLSTLYLSCNSNHQITFTVISATVPDSSAIYITGNNEILGNWHPNKIRLNNIKNNIWSITFPFDKNKVIEYKFTLGSWDKEALLSSGEIPANNVLKVQKDTTLTYNIDKWKNMYNLNNHHDITGQFKVHKNMTFPGLKPRDVIVWLPPNYNENQRTRYPVLYMHDGQNLFDPNTSFLGTEWQVDETTNQLIKQNKINPMIIVAIYNTVDRNDEYGKSKLSEKYMDFIVNKLKPIVDKNYRTKSDRENTATGGSSRGGLISFILLWEYNDIFSKSICMSPAFRYDGFDYVSIVENYLGEKKKIKVYIDNGGLDLEKVLQPGIDDMLEALQSKGYTLGIEYLWFRDKSATHNESAWANRFWRPLEFLFSK